MKVLLTGGSGFIAAHCLDLLLEQGYDVVTTVRSDQKGQKILESHSHVPSSKLSYVIVEDISKEGAFDEAVKSNPPFEAVLHTASPFHFKEGPPEQFLNPAINGTVGILKAIKAFAPTVKRVAITSSFAAIINPGNHPELYDESVWSPATKESAAESSQAAYRSSKTLAEKAAWDFVEKEKPNFELSTLNPPIVLGPVVHYLSSLDAINQSNSTILAMIQGKHKEKIPPTTVMIWVDVRDIALAHVRAIEVPEAAGKRFFITEGYLSNPELATIIKENCPEYADQLPKEIGPPDLPKDVFKIDNSRSKEILGLKYRSLKDTVVDTVRSLQAVGA